MSTWQLFPDGGNSFRWEEEQYNSRQQQRDDDFDDTRRLPSMADLLLLGGCSKLAGNGRKGRSVGLFRTALGKSVEVKHSSIAKAPSVLGHVAAFNKGHLNARENEYASSKSMFEMDSLKSAVTRTSRLQSASENALSMSNSMFQTGSGKTVKISSAGLLRAKALLGADENYNQESLNGFEQTHKRSTPTELLVWENPSHIKTEDANNLSFNSSAKGLTSFSAKSGFCAIEPTKFPNIVNTASKPPLVRFHTAGGRSISVSSDALQRARSLLGNPEIDFNEASTADPLFSVIDDGEPSSSNKKKDFRTPVLHKGAENADSCVRNFTSPPTSVLNQKQSFGKPEKLRLGSNLIAHFDAEAPVNTSNRPYNGLSCDRNPLTVTSSKNVDCLEILPLPKMDKPKRSSNRPLVDISNTMHIEQVDNKQHLGEKRRFRGICSVSPFKKPRSSFVTPLNKNNSSTNNVFSRLAPKESCTKQRVSMRYPVQIQRSYLKEYVLQPPLQKKVESLPEYVIRMNPAAAASYTFQNEVPSDCIGPEAFYRMLSQCGASMQYLTKEWVSNHYKWIVWKLSSYERCYPTKFSGKLLTVSSVLEELRYRYEREVNHGHRSSIKKILDGDAPPSSMMVLCISSVGKNCEKLGNQSISLEDGNDRASIIELTDGWYSLKAQLDELLTQKLASGKLFVGQKLRIWGAKLRGWIGPVSPFEASQTTSLLLHINGTYRCHWAERLGFCKHAGIPLAFRCIKGNGGDVPSTLVGVTRIYPVLYRERLSDGSFIVRSEREEAKALQMYNQRRDAVAEGIIISAFQRETEFNVGHDHESEEGAKLMKLLETATEPEVLMAGMSSKQLTSFASYKAKLEAARQSEKQNSIDKAVQAAGLSEREGIPFLRIKVVGLTNKCHPEKNCPRKGLITIWNPTKKQTLELCEGQAYAVGGLVPSISNSGILYLQTRGSTSKWLPLSPFTKEKFEPFFTPRSSTTISSLDEVLLTSEFDIAAFVLFVGDVYREGHHLKQWVFVTDGSKLPPWAFPPHGKKSSHALLAINFCFPCVEVDLSAPVNTNVVGSVVGFCNLTKRPKDETNGLWVAEATENSDYFLSYDHVGRIHLKDVAALVLNWANTSRSITEKLKDTILSIIRNSNDGC